MSHPLVHAAPLIVEPVDSGVPVLRDVRDLRVPGLDVAKRERVDVQHVLLTVFGPPRGHTLRCYRQLSGIARPLYPHPVFVESLMGFPTGWTELNPSETP